MADGVGDRQLRDDALDRLQLAAKRRSARQAYRGHLSTLARVASYPTVRGTGRPTLAVHCLHSLRRATPASPQRRMAMGALTGQAPRATPPFAGGDRRVAAPGPQTSRKSKFSSSVLRISKST